MKQDEHDPATPAPAPDDLTARSPRQQVLLGAEIGGFGGGTPTKHRIKDLSTTGARVDRAGSLRPGSTVLVSVGVLAAIGATVVWVKDDAAGLRFAEPIDPDAARSKTFVAPKTTSGAGPAPGSTARAPGPVATAGWVGTMANPYRRRH
ncbi:PilZ domain-containing protein [uncultured Sphingomonas sp.]|uniref:PilZ domain-containing protein n=1 Tax=uncultured Sphingomonas sp. TaxID=158754 RepID=UPI0035CA7503